MSEELRPQRFQISFPGDLEYVSSVRKLISEVLVSQQYSHKFAYRSEVIVDEICSNAVKYGCRAVGASVNFECLIWPDHIEMLVKDPGGSSNDISKLRNAVTEAQPGPELRRVQEAGLNGGLGLEIVRMLAESIDVNIDENNITSIRVVRRREETGE